VPIPGDAAPTPDQHRAVEAVVAACHGRARRPLVLTSDRGRGKTSALGFAAARLLAEGDRTVLVTAPRRSAVGPLFLHASRCLPDAETRGNRIFFGSSRLEFLAPDALRLSPREVDLLLVDEAAGIPAPLLERLLEDYGRIVFATTIHGYEGTGRGFELRFRRHLERRAPGWKELRLETPIRHAPGDPLEAFAARALLLDAEPAPASAVAGALPRQCRHERLDRDALVRNDAVLSQVFGLLVLAHYQTRPLDLRHLLDGPNLEVHVLKTGDSVVATALVAAEGGLDTHLGEQIFQGRRRPRGHLLPQTLSAHAGLAGAPRLRFARIVRITVHPAVQGRGLGRRLIEHIVRDPGTARADLVGASFGATADLLAFWKRCGFLTAHLGSARNAASGVHAVVVLRSLTASGTRLQTRAARRLGERLPVLLSGPLRDIEPAIAACILEGTPAVAPGPDSSEWPEIEAFAFGLRPYEAALAPLVRLLVARHGTAPMSAVLDDRERDALVAKLLQHREWAEVAQMAGLAGRAAVISLLRRAVGKLIRSGAGSPPAVAHGEE
jgi:tRNA(Met) cytidine acetyltransferase